jgi:hypothetical protein
MTRVAADEERGYIQARLDHDLAQAIALEALSEEESRRSTRRVAAVFCRPVVRRRC